MLVTLICMDKRWFNSYQINSRQSILRSVCFGPRFQANPLLFQHHMSQLFFSHFLSTTIICLSPSCCSQSSQPQIYPFPHFRPPALIFSVCQSRWEFGKCAVSLMRDKCCFTSPALCLIQYEKEMWNNSQTRTQTLTEPQHQSLLPFIALKRQALLQLRGAEKTESAGWGQDKQTSLEFGKRVRKKQKCVCLWELEKQGTNLPVAIEKEGKERVFVCQRCQAEMLKRRKFPQEAECVVSCCSTQRDKRGKTQSGSNAELVWWGKERSRQSVSV